MHAIPSSEDLNLTRSLLILLSLIQLTNPASLPLTGANPRKGIEKKKQKIQSSSLFESNQSVSFAKLPNVGPRFKPTVKHAAYRKRLKKRLLSAERKERCVFVMSLK